MPTNMSQTEVLGFSTELYVAIHDVARQYEMTFDQVISVLARYETLERPRATATPSVAVDRAMSLRGGSACTIGSATDTRP
jgi:hypothetical protein